MKKSIYKSYERFKDHFSKLEQQINELIKNTNKTSLECPTCKRNVTLFEYGSAQYKKEMLGQFFSGTCACCGSYFILFKQSSVVKEN